MPAEPVHTKPARRQDASSSGSNTARKIIIDRAGTPLARVVPLVRRVDRTAIGSLAGQVDLSGDWDFPQTNAEIAADFGIGG